MTESVTGGLPTQEIAAATGGGAPHPASLMDCHLPLVERVLFQGVRGEVADLHFVKVGLEVPKRHPATRQKDTRHRRRW